MFNQSYSGGITTTKKPTGYWRYHSRCWLSGYHGTRRGAWRPHHERWAYTSNFVQYISGFKWILMMRSGQNISHYTTVKPSVPVWNQDLIWWQNKIDIQKTFPQDYDYELLNRSKTKIPITIVKAQMPSDPNQKSRTRDNNGFDLCHDIDIWIFKVICDLDHLVTKVRCKDLPDSDWGDFRCRRAVDSSSCQEIIEHRTNISMD